VVRCRLRDRRGQCSKPNSTKDPPCVLNAKLYVGGQVPSCWFVSAQVSSTSSSRRSNLRGLSYNSHLVASKRDVNLTELNITPRYVSTDRLSPPPLIFRDAAKRDFDRFPCLNNWTDFANL
ncbi:hypothetical protein AVEN_4042-1, partial [Araneus ventricosus]